MTAGQGPRQELARARVSEELNRRIIEAIPGGIVHVGTEGNILTANAEALRILGLSFDALTNRYTVDFATETLWEDGSPCSVDDYPVTRALRTGQAQPRVTIGIRRQDGTTAWAVFTAVPVLSPEDGSVIGAVATFVDITERRRVEQALRDSEARLRSVVESVPAFVCTIDRAAKLLFVNRLLPGVEPEQVMGRSVLDFVHAENQPNVREVVSRVLEAGSVETFEMRLVPWLGDATYRTSIGPVRYGSEIRGATLVMEDITAQKEMEARLLLSDRLAAVGTLAAGVAHEINNPLTYLLGNLELIGREALSSNMRDRVYEALDGAERIRDVVRDLMTFAHPDPARTGFMSVSDVIDRAVRMAQHELKLRAKVVRDEDPLPELSGNAARLGQVLLNLLINAAHAIRPGDVEHNEIRIVTRRIEDGRIRITVRDTGQGMDRALLGRIFDPFVTTKPTGQGTGLGLYVCHNIVRSLGGTIWVESEPGRGSAFHVDLPCIETRRETSVHGGTSPETKGLRVLVVDDEPAIRAFVSSALPHDEVAGLSSGRDAVEALGSRQFDVVLCDLMMPDGTGLDVYEAAVAAHPELAKRFVFITGVTAGELHDEVIKLSAPILPKPFSIEELERCLARTAR